MLDIAATLLGRDKDRLDGEDVRQHRRNFAWAAGAATALALTTLLALGAAVIADYQRGLAISRQLAAGAELLAEQEPANLPAAVNVAAAAVQRAGSFGFLGGSGRFEAAQTLHEILALLGPRPVAERVTRGLSDHALSPGGRYIARVPYAGPMVIEGAADGAVIAELQPPLIGRMQASGLRDPAFSAGGAHIAAKATLGLTAAVWSLPDGKAVFRAPTAGIWAIALSPDGSRLATTRRVGAEQLPALRVGRVSIWDTDNGRRVTQMAHAEQVTSLTFSRAGDYLLSSSRDGRAALWDAATGSELLVFPHGGSVWRAGFLRIGGIARAWTSGDDGLVRLWELQDPVVERLRLQQQPALLAAVAGGEHLVTITHDLKEDAATDPAHYRREIRAWSMDDLAGHLPMAHEEAPRAARLSADARRLATFDTRAPELQLVPGTASDTSHFELTDPGTGSVRLWDIVSHRQLAAAEHPAAVMAFDLSADGAHLASACADGLARVLDADGNTVASRRYEGWVVNVAFDPEGRRLAVASAETGLLHGPTPTGTATLSLWDWRKDREIARAAAPHVLDSLAFSPDGTVLAAGGWDGSLYLLQTAAGGAPRVLKHDHAVRAIAFSPDGRRLAVGTGGGDPETPALLRGATVLWDLDEESRTTLRQQAGWTGAVAFSPDGRHLAAVDQDGRIGIWRRSGLRQIASLAHGDASPEVRVHFAPDSRHLVSAVGETAKIWDVRSGREVARRRHETGSLWDAGFSPDGAWLATVSTDATAQLWRWRAADLVADACRRLPETMSDAQWRDLVGPQVGPVRVCAEVHGGR